jgi:murein DD-endopeptidase MepM/ murein hydrolase activator NlpD
MRSRIAAFLVVALAPLVLFGVLPLATTGKSLQSRIDDARGRVDRAERKEGVLSNSVAAASQRIGALQGDITVLQRRQNLLQRDLDGKRVQLNRLQDQLRAERARLAELRAKLALSRRVLAVRLTELYKADRPDTITVLLNSRGFAELLERSEFISRINDQDARIIRTVRIARDASERASDRLARLESRQQAVTTAVLVRRNEVASVRLRLVDKRRQYAAARAEKAAALRQVRAQKGEAMEHLASLEREQARIRGVLVGAGGPGVAGPIRRGSGGFIWPVNGPITGSFGENRGDHMHAGIDIPAPTGTPIRAAGSGRVVLAGWTGGYGNYTCIAHGGSVSTCYAHQSSIAVGTGSSVSQGQLIGYVGSTGHSTGPHLHFEVRVGGSPVNPLSYL